MKAHKRKAGMRVLCDICGKPFKVVLAEREEDGKVYREFTCPECGHVYLAAVKENGKWIKWNSMLALPS